MPVFLQILLGTAILILCTLIHIAIEVWLARKLRSKSVADRIATARHTFFICSATVLVLLVSHTIHLYIWAFSLWFLGALPWYEEPIYFSLVTYTTVGYGDVTLPPEFRTFGAMASVNGILAFGLTTAFLVNFFPRVIEELRNE